MSESEAAIDRLISEPDKLGMRAAGALLAEREGGAVHSSTITRWCLKGVRLPSGGRLKLEHYRAGGRLVTTRAAILRFLAAQTDTPVPARAFRTPAQQRRAVDDAARELTQMGI